MDELLRMWRPRLDTYSRRDTPPTCDGCGRGIGTVYIDPAPDYCPDCYLEDPDTATRRESR